MNKSFVPFLPPWVETGLQPAFYDAESGTVLQQTARMYAKVNQLTRHFNELSQNVSNEIKSFEQNINDIVDEYIDKFNQLHDYVYNYFDNLDVQEEINNKLDKMVEDGTIQEIITAYLQISGVLAYNSVADMVASENLINGSKAKTFGYYTLGDGGGAEYYINDTSSNDILSIALNNGLYAHLITDGKTLEVKKLGVHADMVTDDSDILQDIIDFAYDNNLSIKIKGYVYVDTTINTKGVFIYSDEEQIPAVSNVYVSSTRGNLGFTYLNNTGDGANVTFAEWTHDILKVGSGIISDVANPILECNYADGNFRLKNLTIAGWLRNTGQEGIRSVYNSSATYLPGGHMFENVRVCNTGGNGIHLNSLEVTTLKRLSSVYNLGYGVYIEGVSGKDTPFEYTDIRDGDIVGNKLGGWYAKDCFRKHVRFINCNFNRNGLYNEFNESVPETTSEIVSCIKITGKESSSAEARIGFVVESCFGEEIYNFIHLDTTGLVTNNIQIIGNTMFKGTKSAPGACLVYMVTAYSNGIVWRDNAYNGTEGTNIVGSGLSNWYPVVADSGFITKISPLTSTALDDVCSLINAEKSYAYRDNNTVMIQLWGASGGTATAWNTAILSHLPKPEKLLIFSGTVGSNACNFYLYTDGTLKPTQNIAVSDTVKVNINYVPARV